MPPMSSRDFAPVVSPLMAGRRATLAKGGQPHRPEKHSLTVIIPVPPPVGALNRATAPTPATPPARQVHPMAREDETAAMQVMSLVQRLRALPGINIQAFDQGSAMLVRGLETIAASMPRPRR
jgi:hypothetical protein